MAGSVLALSLLGVGVVKALPTAGKPVHERQVWIGDGSATFRPIDGPLPICNLGVALAQQPPCLLPPSVGVLNPPKEKRQVFWIGDGHTTITPDLGRNLPTCNIYKPLAKQGPCLLPPTQVGGFKPGKAKREAEAEPVEAEKRQLWIGEGGTLVPGFGGGSGGSGGLPVCNLGVSLSQQPPCMLPALGPGLIPSRPPKEKRQIFWIGDGHTTITPDLGRNLPTCNINKPLSKQGPCLLPPTQVGGFKPGKAKRDVGEDSKPVEKRQIFWIGDGDVTLVPDLGRGLPTCDIHKPLSKQGPCLLPPGQVGGFKPGKAKREVEELEPVEKRQTWIGGGGGGFFPGTGEGSELPPCDMEEPLAEQPPCFLPPITGEITPPKQKRQIFWIGDGDVTLVPDLGRGLPTCDIHKPLSKQGPCLLPPGQVGGFKPGKQKRDDQSGPVEKRQIFWIGDGDVTLVPDLGRGLPTCDIHKPLSKQGPCLLPPGQVGGFWPGKEKRQIWIGDGSSIFNPGNGAGLPTCDITKDLSKQGPCMLPPLLGLRPGKRGDEFKLLLPPDWSSNPKKVIQQLQKDLVKLQNKKNKTQADKEKITALKSALQYLAGITNISAPPGTETTFTPGKRDSVVFGEFASQCPQLAGVEEALRLLLLNPTPSATERLIIKEHEHLLKACGSPFALDHSNKRDVSLSPVSPDFDISGLLAAHDALLSSSGEAPSLTVWLIQQQLSDLLSLYDGPRFTPKRQTSGGQFGIGTRACELADIMGLRAALAALLTAYGDPLTSPPNIFLVEQVIVISLQLCGQSVQGWTTLIPGSPIPGGPIVPNPTIPGGPIVPNPAIPGGPIVPNPTIPGGPITPDPTRPGAPMKPGKRQAPIGDPAALLAALQALEKQYGSYGSGTIPVPVWLIMVNIVTILQTQPGFVVPGWPVLGQGSVTLTPSP